MNYPNVPNLPGVPPVLRDPLAAATTVAAPVISAFLDAFTPDFGVYDLDGNKLVDPDTFVGIDYVNQRKISSFPVEEGSFANYNKVNEPFKGTIKFAKGGTVADRESFLNSIQSLADSTDLVKIVTPEAVYLEVNMERYKYSRAQVKGANIILADCLFTEIRSPSWAGTPSPVANAKSPTATDKVVAGLSKPIATAASAVGKVTTFLGRGA